MSDAPVRPLDVAAVAGNDVKVKMRDGLASGLAHIGPDVGAVLAL